MAKQWRVHPHDADRVQMLEKSAGLPPILAQLLLRRGVTNADSAHRFLDSQLKRLRDPEDLPGIPAAADQIHAALVGGRRIVVYGDYDADGMTATAVLFRCLKLLGGNVTYYVPNRLEEGYGLSEGALEKLTTRGASLVISVDCGIASLSAALAAQRLGLELVVTDHHEFGDQLPAAAAIVHPRLPGHDYPFAHLCGVGVAFKLAWALCTRASQSKKVSEPMRNFLLSAIGLAAIGTVADVVPLIDENRVLVRHGLKSLTERPTRGIEAMMRVCGYAGKPLTSEDIAFGLAPRLNAAGRLGQAQLGVELLTTEDAERADALAEYIHQLNNSRDSLDRSVYRAANKQINEQFDPEDPAFVLAGRGWHAGVIGIVAGRLAEKYNRPVIIISLDELGTKPGTGSGRSACGLNLHESLRECGEHLLTYGGHAAAAGLKVEEAKIDAFRAAFCEYAAATIRAEDRIAKVTIDAEAPLGQLTLRTVKQIEQMAPFGEGNPRPILCATSVRLAEPPRRLGEGDRHLSAKLSQQNVTLRAIAFGQGEWFDELSAVEGGIDIAYRPVINEFRGRPSVEIHLVDYRISNATSTEAANSGPHFSLQRSGRPQAAPAPQNQSDGATG